MTQKGNTMAKFFDVLGGAAELPDDLKSVLTSAYEEDFSSADAKVDELSTSLADREAAIASMKTEHSREISSLKSANYDLLRAVPKNANSGQQDDEELNSGGRDNDAQITIADLFGKKK